MTENVNDADRHFLGHMRLEARAARLIVSVRGCNESDGTYQYDLPPGQLSYWGFVYYSEASPPERLEPQCAFEYCEWQGLLCASSPSYRQVW